jgi:hypothetical protein
MLKDNGLHIATVRIHWMHLLTLCVTTRATFCYDCQMQKHLLGSGKTRFELCNFSHNLFNFICRYTSTPGDGDVTFQNNGEHESCSNLLSSPQTFLPISSRYVNFFDTSNRHIWLISASSIGNFRSGLDLFQSASLKVYLQVSLRDFSHHVLSHRTYVFPREHTQCRQHRFLFFLQF